MFLDAGLIALIGFVALLLKFRTTILRKILNFDIFLDITVTIALMFMFAGTFSGMMTAMAAGAMFSVTLLLIKWLYGYEKLRRQTCEHCNHTETRWVTVPPRWQVSFNHLRNYFKKGATS